MSWQEINLHITMISLKEIIGLIKWFFIPRTAEMEKARTISMYYNQTHTHTHTGNPDFLSNVEKARVFEIYFKYYQI